jgi:hypothetical protein
MKNCLWALTVLLMTAAVADAEGPVHRSIVRQTACRYPWHGAFYDPAWGAPTALVVPPTSSRQTKWAWGVSNTSVVPIYHQYRRGYPGNGYDALGVWPTPPQPGHTDQFGYYYVRGPW